MFGTRTQQSYLRSSSRQVQDQTLWSQLYTGGLEPLLVLLLPCQDQFQKPFNIRKVSAPSCQCLGSIPAGCRSQLSVLCIFPSSAWLCEARVSDSCRLVLSLDRSCSAELSNSKQACVSCGSVRAVYSEDHCSPQELGETICRGQRS